MTGLDQRSITITARFDDVYDAIVRMLVDSQRLGFALVDIALTTEGGHDTSIRITVLVDAKADCCSIRARFARHPALRDVRAFENGDGPCNAASNPAPLRALETCELLAKGVAA